MKEVIHSNKKLLLVFEYVDYDLKKFMGQFSRDKGMDPMVVKVSFIVILEFLLSTVKRHRLLSPEEDLASGFETTEFIDF